MNDKLLHWFKKELTQRERIFFLTTWVHCGNGSFDTYLQEIYAIIHDSRPHS